MDRFTGTRIPARYSRYRHNTLDLHVLENVRSSLALYLPPSSLLQLSFVGGQGCPAQEASWARTTHPLFDVMYIADNLGKFMH